MSFHSPELPDCLLLYPTRFHPSSREFTEVWSERLAPLATVQGIVGQVFAQSAKAAYRWVRREKSKAVD